MKPNAQKSIDILEKLSLQCSSADLAYLVLPNVVLTLSGARAYCDGIFWDEDKKGLLTTWNKEIDTVMTELRKVMDIFWCDTGIVEARPGESYASFELLSNDGLIYRLKTSKLLHHTPPEAFLKLRSFSAVQQLIIDDLQKQEHYQDKSKEDLQHISFGFLLGYPDAAILAVNPESNPEDPFRESTINANIKGAGYYTCPQPYYFYPYSLYGNPEIVENEQLWSSILIEYYTSDFHKKLEKDSSFRAKLKQLGNLR